MLDRLLNFLSPNKEKAPSLLTDYSLMRADMHSHLIPGIDDGAKTMEDTIALLQGLKELGFKKIVTSPHVMADGYTNSTETIIKGRDAVREAIKQNNIDIEFDAAAEYNIDESLYPKIEKKDLLTFTRNYILVEMPFLAKPTIMGDIVYKLQTAGYNVVLAHPERYSYFHEKDFHTYHSLKDKNIFFQINIASLCGAYGKGARYTAIRMINEHMVNFVGTDLHGANHLNILRECLKERYLEKILTYDKLLNKTI
ncbi:MAG TPA: CpsB/CapC family capsule biosynthesis tyrosine phosphatase [Chitinophagales bacterium]|nr:CpsB/CapC family capsule biosynthesis tyrosine phosphatase [Chitinophagales bacterium]